MIEIASILSLPSFQIGSSTLSIQRSHLRTVVLSERLSQSLMGHLISEDLLFIAASWRSISGSSKEASPISFSLNGYSICKRLLDLYHQVLCRIWIKRYLLFQFDCWLLLFQIWMPIRRLEWRIWVASGLLGDLFCIGKRIFVIRSILGSSDGLSVLVIIWAPCLSLFGNAYDLYGRVDTRCVSDACRDQDLDFL